MADWLKSKGLHKLCSGPKAWNDLPYKLRIENSLLKFKKGLKLHFCIPNLVAEFELITYIVDLLAYLFVCYFSSSYAFTLLPVYFSYM